MKRKRDFHHQREGKDAYGDKHPQMVRPEGDYEKSKLEIVLKCDTSGSEEAVVESLRSWKNPEVDVNIIHAGVGAVTKSDLLMALTGSRLIVGFNVSISPKLNELCKEQGIEIRLYDVIYRLTNDIFEIAKTLIHKKDEDKTTGTCKVIALFPGSRKGIILGCEVLEGKIELGKNFRVISAMGPVYESKIESLRIENNAVKEAKRGQQVGIKISDSSIPSLQ